MICRECGKPIPDDSIFCPLCGCKLDILETVTNHNNSYGQDDSSLNILIPVVAINTDYYIPQFMQIINGEKCSFNIPAFFFNMFFCIYRKCYDLLKKYFLIPISIFFAGTILSSIGISISSTPLTAIGSIAITAGAIWEFINSIRLGISFNKDYYEHCMDIISNGTINDYGTSAKNTVLALIIYMVVCTIPGLFPSISGKNYNNTQNLSKSGSFNPEKSDDIIKSKLEETSPAIAYDNVTVDELYSALHENNLNASNLYKNTNVAISGYIASFDTDGTYITIDDGSDFTFDTIMCYLKTEEQKKQAATMKKRQHIVVCGTITEVSNLFGYYLNIDHFGNPASANQNGTSKEATTYASPETSNDNNLNFTSNSYSPSDFLGGWGSSGGRDELAIEMEGNTFKVTWSGSYGYNSGGVTEMTCIFQNGRLEFNDGTNTTYLLGDYIGEEASIVEYTHNNGFFYLCSPEEVDSYYDKFRNYTIYSLARDWDGYGDSAVPLDNGPYLLLIQEPIENYASSEYVIWYSSQIRLSENDISFLSDADKRIAVNEIYARHGRKFNDSELQQHFNQCSWYRGTVDPASFNENVLSATEKYNIQLLAPENGQNVSAMKDPAGIYVEDGGVYMVTGDRDGPLTGYVEITNNIYGTYDVWVAESYKGSPYGTVDSIVTNTPFYITSEYKGSYSSRALVYDGYDTITVTDEYQNVSVYHRITDDIKNHINYDY